jgi:hypothetical protein
MNFGSGGNIASEYLRKGSQQGKVGVRSDANKAAQIR